jgi:tetratricopeptide (TPR) repeat protein
MTITDVILECERLLETARLLGDDWSVGRATHELARHHFFAGHAQRAEELLTAQIARYPIGQAPPLDYQMQLATMYWGPRPISEAVSRAGQIRREMDSKSSEAAARRAMGGMLAMAGDTEAGLTEVREAAAIEESLGRLYLAASSRGQVEGPMLAEAGRYEEAERVMLDAYEQLTATGDRGFAPSVAGHLAALYVRMDRWAEAEKFANLTLAGSAPDDVEAQSQGLQALGRARAAQGDLEGGLEAARKAVQIAEATDYLHRRGTTKANLAEVLLAAGRRDEAIAMLRDSWAHFDAKGAKVPAATVERRLAELGAAVEGAG